MKVRIYKVTLMGTIEGSSFVVSPSKRDIQAALSDTNTLNHYGDGLDTSNPHWELGSIEEIGTVDVEDGDPAPSVPGSYIDTCFLNGRMYDDWGTFVEDLTNNPPRPEPEEVDPRQLSLLPKEFDGEKGENR